MKYITKFIFSVFLVCLCNKATADYYVCAICKYIILADNIFLCCEHRFHKRCIEEHRKNNKNCPLCLVKICYHVDANHSLCFDPNDDLLRTMAEICEETNY